MNQRMKAAVRLATLFVVVILGTSLFFTMSMERDARFEDLAVLEVPSSNVQSLQLIDLDGDGEDDLFVQDPSSFTVFGVSGEPLWGERLQAPVSTTMGDVDADGDEDLVTFQAGGAVRATSGGSELWSVRLNNVAQPARAAVIRFSSGTQVVVGDTNGQLVALSGATGGEVWRAQLTGDSEARGLDDALRDGDRLLVAANRGGGIEAFSADGRARWQTSIGGLRRMRTFDTDGDGRSEVYSGGEGGTLFVWGADGEALWNQRIGQQVVEIRDGELDGDPTSREIIVGGRDGGVFVFGSDGSPVWAESVGERVSDLAALDLDDDGSDEVVVGGDRGGFTVFSGASGARYSLPARTGGVDAIEEGRFTDANQVVVAAGNRVTVLQLTRHNAPFFYSPLVAGLVLSLVIAGAAVFVGNLPEPLSTRVVVTDSSPEGLLARRRMLHENVADVEELKAKGEIGGPEALAKLESLRAQMAEADQELRRVGVSALVESVKCPNCGGRVRLGKDKCDYCGEVVIA